MNRKVNLKKKFVPSLEPNFCRFLNCSGIGRALYYRTIDNSVPSHPLRYFSILLSGLFLYVVSIIQVGNKKKPGLFSRFSSVSIVVWAVFKSGKRWLFFALASRSFIFFLAIFLTLL